MKTGIRKGFFGAALVMFFTACGTSNQVAEIEKPSDEMPFESVASGVMHGAGEEGISATMTTIDSKEEWDALKTKMDGVNPISSSFRDENLDFNKEKLVVCIDEVRPNGSYQIQILKIEEYSTYRLAHVERSNSEGPSTSVMVQPFHIVRVARSEKETRFVETVRVY